MNPTVVIADDSALVRAVLGEELSTRGFIVREAADGAEALAVCRQTPPDIVLLDVDMPIRDGHQVLVELRADPNTRDIPVVFLTGRIEVADAAEALRLGAHDYLRKPVEPIELIARMSAALRVKDLQDRLRRRNAELSEYADQLEGVNSRLRAANQLATDLIAMLSHDLRQPLTTIIGYTEILVAEHADAEADADRGRQRSALERTHAAARQLQQLVEDVLVMAQSDAGVMPTRPARVAVAEELRTSLSTLAVSADEVEIDHPEEAYAEVDPGHLRQILTNLVGNAFKYGARPIRVTVTTEPGAVEIRVSDAGQGVPPEFVPQVFDRFSRATNGTAAGAQGTGLGLYIVRQLTQANGGSIHYEPRHPHGATFVVRLPSHRG